MVQVYLDSTKLTDLHTLFTEGVHKCEVLVLLASEHVLTRPWCLLELSEAGRLGIPVIPLGLERVHSGSAGAKPRFDLLAARHFINNLEVQLELISPGALADLHAHLAATHTSIRQFKSQVLTALGVADPRVVRLGAPDFPRWHSGGTDAQIIADVKDLVLAMGGATGRSLRWSDHDEEDHHAHYTLHSCLAASCAAVARGCGLCRYWGGSPRQLPYSLFIACCPEDTSDVARFLQSALTRKFAEPVLQEIGPEVDDASIDDLLSNGVGKSHGLLLLLSSGVLRRPWTLLQAYEAIRLHRPIICVEVQGCGYSHAGAKHWLNDLRGNLGVHARDEMRRVLHARGHSFQQLQAALSVVIPSIIAITLTPSGSQNHVDAVLVDITERAERERELSRDPSVSFTALLTQCHHHPQTATA